MGGFSFQWILRVSLRAQMCMWKGQRSRLGIAGETTVMNQRHCTFPCLLCFTVIDGHARSSIGWIMVIVTVSQEPRCQTLCYGLGGLRTLLLASDRKSNSNLLGESGTFITHVIEKSRSWFQAWQKAAYLLTLLFVSQLIWHSFPRFWPDGHRLLQADILAPQQPQKKEVSWG